jgi:hypothetical protein
MKENDERNPSKRVSRLLKEKEEKERKAKKISNTVLLHAVLPEITSQTRYPIRMPT